MSRKAICSLPCCLYKFLLNWRFCPIIFFPSQSFRTPYVVPFVFFEFSSFLRAFLMCHQYRIQQGFLQAFSPSSYKWARRLDKPMQPPQIRLQFQKEIRRRRAEEVRFSMCGGPFLSGGFVFFKIVFGLLGGRVFCKEGRKGAVLEG